MPIARYYIEEHNPGGAAFIPGVPLRDLTEEEFAALSARQQRTVDASGLFRKTKPQPAAPRRSAARAAADAAASDAPADQPGKED